LEKDHAQKNKAIKKERAGLFAIPRVKRILGGKAREVDTLRSWTLKNSSQ